MSLFASLPLAASGRLSEPALIIGKDAAALTALDLLEQPHPAYIIDPAGRWRPITAQRGMFRAALGDDAINLLDFRSAVGDDVINALALQVSTAADLIVALCHYAGVDLRGDGETQSALRLAIADAYRERDIDILAVDTHRDLTAADMPTVEDVRTQIAAQAVQARQRDELGQAERLLALADALHPLTDPDTFGPVCDRPCTLPAGPADLHIDLGHLAARTASAAALIAVDDARKRARPGRTLTLIVDHAELVFADDRAMDYLAWLARAPVGLAPRFITDSPQRMLWHPDGTVTAHGRQVVDALTLKVITRASSQTLGVLVRAGVITAEEAGRLSDTPEGEALTIRGGQRRWLSAGALIADRHRLLESLTAPPQPAAR